MRTVSLPLDIGPASPARVPGKDGPAHKGSQDFVWSLLAPVPQPFTRWERVKKPARGAAA